MQARPFPRDLLSPGFLLLLLFVGTAPVPYGCVLPGGILKLHVLAFLTAVFAFSPAFAGPEARLPALARAAIAAMLGLALLAVFQLLPLPHAVVRALSPSAAEVYRSAGETLTLLAGSGSAASSGIPNPLSRLSLHPSETASVGLLTLAYAAIFVSAFRLLGTRLRRRVFFGVLLGSTLVYVAAGMPGDAVQPRLHGPYVNPDHFAGYLQIGLAVAFGLSWAVLSRVMARGWRGWGQGDGADGRGDRVEQRLVATAAVVLVWGLVATAIGLTRSRGGMLAAAGSTLFLVTMSAISGLRRTREGDRRRRAVSGGAAVLLGLLFVAAAAGSRPLLRFLETDPRDLGSDTRVRLWDLSVQAWKSFPVFGSGMGAYREGVRQLQPRDLVFHLEYAHNDALQLLVTGGALGALLGAIAFGALLFCLARAWPLQPHREERAFALAGLGALVSLALHGLVEFNFSLPATPALLAAVLGASLAAAVASPEREESPVRSPVRSKRATSMGLPASTPTANVDRP